MKQNHHFIEWDDVNSYLKRCITLKMSQEMTRDRACVMCLQEYHMKKQKKSK